MHAAKCDCMAPPGGKSGMLITDGLSCLSLNGEGSVISTLPTRRN